MKGKLHAEGKTDIVQLILNVYKFKYPKQRREFSGLRQKT